MPTTTHLRRASWTLAAVLALAASASAQKSPDWVTCETEVTDAVQLDQRIAACARIIDSRATITPRELAIAYNNRGKAHRKKSDIDKSADEIGQADQDFKLAMRSDTTFAEPYLGVGEIVRLQGWPDRAIYSFGQAIQLDPKNARAYYLRAMAKRDMSIFGKTSTGILADLTQAIKLDPSFADAITQRGRAYLGDRQYDRAIADFNQAIKLTPMEPFTHIRRCQARALANRDLKLALVDCNEALRLDPNEQEFFTGRGLLYLRLGDWPNAIADLTKAMDLDPTDDDPVYLLAVAKIRSGDAEGGQKRLNQSQPIKDLMARKYGIHGIAP